jgi:DNA topoisomerase-3
MKTLILTEKPSVAMDFARALAVKGKKDGYLEDARYIITWAIGHLVELLEPHDYDSKWKRWRLEALPIMPDKFLYKPIKERKKQLSIIRTLLAKRSFENLVIATDAGREGEVIARSILSVIGFKGNGRLKRFWTSQALTPEVVRGAMKSLKPASEYDRLWRAGQLRQIADWLVGMNLTRAATVKMNDLFSVGRVQTAVLSLLVDRRREREDFKPEPYWTLNALFSNPKGAWWGIWFKGDQTRFKSAKQGNDVISKIAHQVGTVLSVKKQKKQQPPPPLYSLTDLQREANAKYTFSAQKTLNLAQALYDRVKCLSYPRTDSRVLGSQNVRMAQSLVKNLSQPYPDIFARIDSNLISASNKRVFNDAKLTDHHAIIPLAPVPSDAKDDAKILISNTSRQRLSPRSRKRPSAPEAEKSSN